MLRRASLFLLAAIAVGAAAAAQDPPTPAQPETVMITLHAKPGAEAALAQTIARHFDTARRLGLLAPDGPHLTMHADESGRRYYVEILTWKDAVTPDNAPSAIRAIWDEMNRLVDARGGRPGLDIAEMAIQR
jgi:hypothetical protein